MNKRTPFIIKPDFLSPALCEYIIKTVKVLEPNRDRDGNPLKIERQERSLEPLIIERFRDLIDEIEFNYDCSYLALNYPVFQYYPENPKMNAEPPGCENSEFSRRKWNLTKHVDLVGYIWLKDFADTPPLDFNYEMYGARLEFPAHNFSLVPQRGTLVLYPAGPQFVRVISPVMAGDNYQIKLNVQLRSTDGNQWIYTPSDYPGTWREWLNDHI